MVEMGVLLELQDLDLELHRFREERDKIPGLLDEVESEFDKVKVELDSQEVTLKALKMAIREAEGKVAQLEEISTRYKQQLLSVKTNREYSAFLTEIEGVKREKEELEEEILRDMGKGETVSAGIEQSRQKLAELVNLRQEKKVELNGRLKEVNGQIAVLESKRTELIKKINVNLLKQYERIMNSRVSRAVVALRNGSCGGCFAHVPLQKVADIRIAHQVYSCDHCGRILYYEEQKGN
ncbi:MAG TPA: C4-type zinc ribbon domain-containing protein [Candidatus Glassbacteria bacterium]|nr:C4-type zinc ribbon domain-containing protein [Candidatus Glassbacteria bacterium]